MKKINNLTSFFDHLNEQYGKEGTPERDRFEHEFEVFKQSVMDQEYPIKHNPNNPKPGSNGKPAV